MTFKKMCRWIDTEMLLMVNKRLALVTSCWCQQFWNIESTSETMLTKYPNSTTDSWRYEWSAHQNMAINATTSPCDMGGTPAICCKLYSLESKQKPKIWLDKKTRWHLIPHQCCHPPAVSEQVAIHYGKFDIRQADIEAGWSHMDVSLNGGTPKSSILIGFSI